MYADAIANCSETRVRLQRQVNLIGVFCDTRKCVRLQRQVNLIGVFYDTRNMKVNLYQTEITVFRNGGPSESEQ